MNAVVQHGLGRISQGLKAVLGWWWGELSGMLPERLRRFASLEPVRWVVSADGADLVIQHSNGADPEAQTVHRVPLSGSVEAQRAALPPLARRDRPEVIFRLPARACLRKQVQLPLAAEENLREVLAFNMDQQTPLKANQVYYDYALLERDIAQKRLRVDLLVAPRAVVDEALAKLGAIGLQADAVDAEGATQPGPSFNLIPPGQRREQAAPLKRLNLTAAVLALGLLAAGLAIPLVKDHWTALALGQALAEARSQANEADALRKDLDALVADARFLIDKKKSTPVAVQVLHELTRLLPDDTWLYQFELNGAEMLIQGESTASSAIIGLIEASKMFRNVQFRSPVTQNRVTGAERFNVSAEVTTEVKPEAAGAKP
ncbi:MAG: PilN domain-containing protein [Gammaproteobacteria bacterium]